MVDAQDGHPSAGICDESRRLCQVLTQIHVRREYRDERRGVFSAGAMRNRRRERKAVGALRGRYHHVLSPRERKSPAGYPDNVKKGLTIIRQNTVSEV